MDIDLPPSEWRSERKKPHEPFFGEGAVEFFAWLIGLGTTATLIAIFKHYLLR